MIAFSSKCDYLDFLVGVIVELILHHFGTRASKMSTHLGRTCQRWLIDLQRDEILLELVEKLDYLNACFKD